MLGVISERLEQLACTAAILLNGRACSPSMDLEPVAKAHDYRFIRLGRGGWVARAHAELHQVVVTTFYTKEGVVIELAPVR